MRGAGCKWVIGSFALFYMLALVVLVIGVFGLFGQDRDPLSAVYLVPLGLPWVLWTDGAPEMMLPWIAALAPALNLGILIALCKAFRAWRGAR